MNAYQKDFFDIKKLLTKNFTSLGEAKEAIKPIFLKLNNPTFYKKHIYSSPVAQYDIGGSDYSNNPLVRFTSDCIKIINESQELSEMLKLLQLEYSWTASSKLTYLIKNA